MTEDMLLQVRSLSVRYGRSLAVSDIDINVERGSISSIIGANGAGKSSTLRAIAGLIPMTGSVIFDGKDVTGRACDQLVELGIALVPEQRQLFQSLTVGENLRLGAYRWANKSEYREELSRTLGHFPELSERLAERAGNLSGGQQQMLAIGRALMSRPRLLMLDEPCTGLAPIVVRRLSDTIGRIAQDGVTVLLIEQNAQIALELSDYGYVMETGVIKLQGKSAELAASGYVKDVYLGV